MLKQTLKKIIGRDFAFKIKLFYSQKSGSYFTNKPLGQKEDYIKLYNNFLEKIKKKSFVNDHFTDEDIKFINGNRSRFFIRNNVLCTKIAKKKLSNFYN